VHKTTTIITISHRSREMAISLAAQRTLVTGTKTKPVTGTQHQQHVSAQLIFVTGIKQQPLPTLDTGHVKRTVSLGPQGPLVTGTKTMLVTVISISETRVVNLRLQCLNKRAITDT
jgi:hypothetical protein